MKCSNCGMKKVLSLLLAIVLTFPMCLVAVAYAETSQEETTVDMEFVDSSVFSRVGYDEEHEILVLQFKETKDTYAYYDVPVEIYDEFVEAESLGSYFNENIKDEYEYLEIYSGTTKAATESTTERSSSETQPEGRSYVLNTNTKKFHYPSCSSVKDMKEKNKSEVVSTRSELISRGYDPCGRCKP